MSLPRLENAEVSNRRVLLRSDFSAAVESNPAASGNVTDPELFGFLKPSMELLRNRGARIVILAHSGTSPETAPSFENIADALATGLGGNTAIEFAADPAAAAASSAPIVLLENLLRFPGEVSGDAAFAAELAKAGDLFVNDSFGACRHEYASVMELPKLLPSSAGLHLYKEQESLSTLLNRDNKPLVLILGGVRLAEKLKLSLRLMEKIDSILIGGGLAYTFLKSRALPVGSSFVEKDLEVPAFQMIEKAELSETEFLLPLDHVAAEQFSRDSKTKNVAQNAIPERWFALDIGSKTISRFEKVIKKAGCVFWYGPMGAVEMEKFSKGTRAIATALARSKAHTVAAGVDTVRSVYAAKLADKFAHLSSDSATALEFLLNGSLPGLTALSGEP